MGEEPDAIRAEREETRERVGDTVELDIRPTERLAGAGPQGDVKTPAKESVSEKVDAEVEGSPAPVTACASPWSARRIRSPRPPQWRRGQAAGTPGQGPGRREPDRAGRRRAGRRLSRRTARPRHARGGREDRHGWPIRSRSARPRPASRRCSAASRSPRTWPRRPRHGQGERPAARPGGRRPGGAGRRRDPPGDRVVTARQAQPPRGVAGMRLPRSPRPAPRRAARRRTVANRRTTIARRQPTQIDHEHTARATGRDAAGRRGQEARRAPLGAPRQRPRPGWRCWPGPPEWP